MGGGAIVAAALFVFGSLRHDQPHKVVQAATLPVVKTAPPKPTKPMLPGVLTAVAEAFVYAPTTGSVNKLYKDKGDRVNKGDMLAEIELPNIDRDVQRARAAATQAEDEAGRAMQELETAKRMEEQARADWERYKTLFEHGAVARQEVDRIHENLRGATASSGAAQSNVVAAERSLEAKRASLNRLTGREPFEYVRAPFSGVVTLRNVDAGDAIEGGSELFRLAEIGILRILVNAPSIRTGQRATVYVSEVLNAAFAGRVVRAADSEVEVEVPNSDRKLLPGMHGHVRIESGTGR
jgi:multidrug efflux pump subunit AcrA (membrane-fusion protein)